MTWPGCSRRSNAGCSSLSRIEWALASTLVLTGCGPAPGNPRAHDEGQPVLRAVYRDATRRLLVVLPGAGRGLPAGDCAAPLLIDDASGAVRQLGPAEARSLMARMQLSGAVQGTCPKG